MTRLAILSTSLALSVLAGSAPLARADDAEVVEARLKTAGIADDLRAAIRASVERGAAFLRSRQREHGGFPGLVVDGVPVTTSPFEAGPSALCALALHHTGLPDAVAAAHRTQAHLLLDGSPVRQTIERGTYEAGVVALLLAADRKRLDVVEALGKRMVKWQRQSGWWDYGEGRADVNLSTTQFAMLGLWAAARVGAKVPAKTWRSALQAHLSLQGADGRWGYEPARMRDVGPRASPYPQGTFMGLSNVILAEWALADELRKDVALSKRVADARARAAKAMALDVPGFFRTLDEGKRTSDFHRLFPYYSLYALEKACLFAGVEVVGDVRWYERGARLLLAKQASDGSWPPLRPGTMSVALPKGEPIAVEPEDERIRTAFALLFLLRVPETDRPTTPRPTPEVTPPSSDPK